MVMPSSSAVAVAQAQPDHAGTWTSREVVGRRTAPPLTVSTTGSAPTVRVTVVWAVAEPPWVTV